MIDLRLMGSLYPGCTFPDADTRTPEEKRRQDSMLMRHTEIAPEDAKEANSNEMLFRKFFYEMLQAMHSGTIANTYEEWLNDDIVWDNLSMPIPIYAKGKQSAVTAYNIICEKIFGGPSSTLTLTFKSFKMLSKDRVKTNLQVSINNTVHQAQLQDERVFYARLVEGKISRVLVTHGRIDELWCSEAAPIVSEGSSSSCGLSSEPDKVELPPPTLGKPCDHNNWDSVRIKRQFALLRCRNCSSQWKILASEVRRCNPYMDGYCPGGCGLMHVNPRKQTHDERSKSLAAKHRGDNRS